MFKIKTEVASVKAIGIVAVGAVDVYRIVERLAEISAHKVFVAEFGSEGCAPQNPVEPAVEVKSEHIGAVIVEGRLVGRSSVKLITVLKTVPVNRRPEVELASFRLSLNGREIFCGMLILLVGQKTVERIAAPSLVANSGVPSYREVVVIIASLIECPRAFVVGVETSALASQPAVAARIARAQLIVPLVLLQINTSSGSQIAKRASFGMNIGTAFAPSFVTMLITPTSDDVP